MTEDKKPKKILIPRRRESKIIEVASNTDLLVNDARAIIASELSKYRSKSVRGVTLDLREARVVQGYLETLIKLQREERETARSEDLSNLSDSELLELASKVLTNAKAAPAASDDEEE